MPSFTSLRLKVKVYSEGRIGADGDLPLSLTYLNSPFMIVTRELDVTEDGDGGWMLEGLMEAKNGSGLKRNTPKSPQHSGEIQNAPEYTSRLRRRRG